MKVAILGGGGCFGLNFARHLDSLGIECFGIGRSGPKTAPFWLAPKAYQFWPLHIVDQRDHVLALLDSFQPDVIVNFAAQGEGAASFGDNAPDFYRTNTWGLVALATQLQRLDYLQRFIHIGTSELYGSVDRPSKETDPLYPNSPYAVSKAAFDRHLEIMFKIQGFPMNIIRPSNCITAGQQLWRIVPKTVVCALSGRKLPLHGGGKAKKSYLDAEDLSRAIVAVIERAPLGKIYNVGPAEPTTIRDLVTMTAMMSIQHYEDLIEEFPDRVGQDGTYWLDSNAIAEDCGWEQAISLPNAISRVVNWVRVYPELLTMPTEYVHRV